MRPMATSLPPPVNRAATREEVWPWGVGGRMVTTSSGQVPRITVITPSFNQANFLEMTIRSVLLQGYGNLEYIIIDGGSTDGSREIIAHYDRWLSWWESGPDRGQCHAINKGLERATGEIVCWLNSDDYFTPGTLEIVGRALAAGTGQLAIAGHVLKVTAESTGPSDLAQPVLLAGRFEGRRRLLEIWKPYEMHQAAIFWRRELTERIGLLDEDLELVMDFDYWVRMASCTDFVNIDRVMAVCHYHRDAKTGDDYAGYHRALRRRVWRYWGSPLRSEFWYLATRTLRHSWLPALKKR